MSKTVVCIVETGIGSSEYNISNQKERDKFLEDLKIITDNNVEFSVECKER